MHVEINGLHYPIRSIRIAGDPSLGSIHPEVRIEECLQPDGSIRWAVRCSSNVLGTNGWEWEPQPSSRDDAFLARCRYPTPEAALAAYLDEHHPKGIAS